MEKKIALGLSMALGLLTGYSVSQTYYDHLDETECNPSIWKGLCNIGASGTLGVATTVAVTKVLFEGFGFVNK